jgi:hypothetical protein
MKSDIILNDEKVEIVAQELTVKDKNGKEGLEYHDSKLTIGNSQREGHFARLLVADGDEKTLVTSRYLSSGKLIADTINGKKINAGEIEIGPTAADSPKISKIILNNKQGNAVITLDGEKEDILLSSIGGNGSLTDKIKELERKIDELKRLHQMG